MATVDGTLPEKGLYKGTNWWGAFVIGLAGTILVTGIAPVVVQGTGALGIILMGVMTIAGCFLCFCLAELATMWPDRTGGIPSFATESFRPLVDGFGQAAGPVSLSSVDIEDECGGTRQPRKSPARRRIGVEVALEVGH